MVSKIHTLGTVGTYLLGEKKFVTTSKTDKSYSCGGEEHVTSPGLHRGRYRAPQHVVNAKKTFLIAIQFAGYSVDMESYDLIRRALCGGRVSWSRTSWRKSPEYLATMEKDFLQKSSPSSRSTVPFSCGCRLPRRNHTTWMVVLLVTAIVSMVTPGEAQQSPVWTVPPNDTSVRSGGTVTLPCRFGNLGNNQIAWLKEGINYFIDGNRWSAPDRFSVTKIANSGYDLVLTGADTEDDSQYTCQLQSGELTAVAMVTVLGECCYNSSFLLSLKNHCLGLC